MKENSSQSIALTPRPPIVVIMGHIDHGKSTLLDYIRKANSTAKEAGGITQHVGAYEALHTDKEGKERKITFLDTPGHEAFGKIRSRGAKVADVAVLVVSAEESVKPQTLEALKFIKENDLQYVVAITKIDKPDADVERVKKNLLENEVYLEGWGGEIPNVALSSKTGEGVSDLLEVISLMADIMDLKANPQKPAEGVVVESHLDRRKGITATLIIQDGSLETGQAVLAGNCLSSVRMLEDFQGKSIKKASFSSPVRIIGWSEIPPAGELFKAYDTKKEAEARREEVEKINEEMKSATDKSGASEKVIEETRAIIPLIIKADVWSSVEAMEHELEKIKSERVTFQIVSKGVGDINEGDIKSGAGSAETTVVGFNVKIDKRAEALIERLGIKTHTSDIIYKLTEWLGEIVKERTPKISTEEAQGEAKVLKQFGKEKDRQILGGKVTQGVLTVGANVKISRRDFELGKGVIKELQQQKNKTKEVSEGNEFGILVESKIEIMPGDKIIPYIVVEK
ncbi:MAG: translation initiation factor IF-2 [bacterium]|nr:translation initiation factor IF-2 [bacterium]